MIAAFFEKRRNARIAREDEIRRAADELIRFNRGDLDRAFWRAHDRAVRIDQPKHERRYWYALLDEIDQRRPAFRLRADTATRMLLRD